jgi:vacuolar-type H+-ATPase subunit I/STV1
MSEEEKGFVIRDKRGFTSEGEVKPETEVTEEEKKGEEKEEAEKNETPKKEEIPLPEINLSSFVLSLSSSALFHFGQIPDPLTKKKERNLPLAKQTIDILGVLQEKTKGNLTKDEEQLIENLLHDLRLKYVEESGKG